jgi:hypothetical protein
MPEQEEHAGISKTKSETRDSIVLLVAVGPHSPRPLATAISAGSIIMTSMTTLSKENIILFMFILLVELTAYYLCHITFVIYIVAKKRKIPHFFSTFRGFFPDLSTKW